MSKNFLLLVSIFLPLISFVFLSLSIYFFFDFHSVTLTIWTDAEEGERWELYYDSGKGFNAFEVLSKKIKYSESGGVVEFEIPRKAIRSIRIDPGSEAKIVSVKKICAASPHEKKCWLPSDIIRYFNPTHHISTFAVSDGALHIGSTGNDPYFTLRKDLSSVIDIRRGIRENRIYYLIAFLFSLLLFFSLNPLHTWFQKNRSNIKAFVHQKLLQEEQDDLQGQTGRIQRVWGNLAVFSLVLLYLSFWAVIKPPGQSPDEFAHFIRALSVPQHPWVMEKMEVDLSKERYNPIMGYTKNYTVPFHYENKYTAHDYQSMKALLWTGEKGTVGLHTSAFSYPSLYYTVVFSNSQFVTRLLSLNPFDSFYIFRLITAFYASLLWIWVYRALCTFPSVYRYRNTLFWSIILIPMLGFISSSINPDAFIIPLISLLMIYSYHVLIPGTKLWQAVTAFILCLFVKPAALILFPVLMVLTGIVLFFTDQKRELIKNSLLLLGISFLVSYVGFYHWSQPVLHGNPVFISLKEYVAQLALKLPGYYIMYWGNLGWLDYSLERSFYNILLGIIFLNIFGCVIDWRKFLQLKWPFYILSFSVVFSLGVIAGEYHYLSKAGYTIQGRYFLPVALGLSVFLVHRLFFIRYLFLVYLAFLNLALVGEHFFRYFGLRLQEYPAILLQMEDYLPFF